MTEIKIETDRLVIRPFQEKDSAGYFDRYKAPTVHCFMPDKISTFAAARNIVLTKETQRATEMAVCLKDTDRHVYWHAVWSLGRCGYLQHLLAFS